MSGQEIAQSINDRAIAWIARIDHASLDPQEQIELDIWLAADERHRGAFFRARVAWNMLDRASVLGVGALITPSVEEHDESRWWNTPLDRRQALWGGGAIAASIAAMAGGVMLWSKPSERIETALGEIRRVPLRDGSLAAVNTATRLDVDLQPDIRNVRIEEGEAWFQVAKDRTRPFVVAAGDVRVRAIGTAFSVRRLEKGADVQVTEGVVEVWTVGREVERTRVSSGTRTFVSFAAGPAAPREASVDIDRKLSWRDGQLMFEGDTLGTAAAEFNRYNTVKIEIDPALLEEKVVGRFRTNEPDAFARAASTMFDARMDFAGKKIRLSRN